jgi:hypothetical protein
MPGWHRRTGRLPAGPADGRQVHLWLVRDAPPATRVHFACKFAPGTGHLGTSMGHLARKVGIGPSEGLPCRCGCAVCGRERGSASSRASSSTLLAVIMALGGTRHISLAANVHGCGNVYGVATAWSPPSSTREPGSSRWPPRSHSSVRRDSARGLFRPLWPRAPRGRHRSQGCGRLRRFAGFSRIPFPPTCAEPSNASL